MAAKAASDSQAAIAQRIKQLLNKKGRSRKGMASDLKVTTETLNSWASRGSIKRDHLTSFTRYVGCTTDYLLTGEDEEQYRLVHSKDSLAPGVEQHHIPVPVLETSDLMTDGAMGGIAGDEMVSRATVTDRVEKWISNPQTATEVYIPFLLNHKHFEPDIPGTPRYGIQITQGDHGEDLHGQVAVMATDIWPDRDDWCLFLRRPMYEVGLFEDLANENAENTPALWSLHAGFYRSDGWSVPKDADAWWNHAAGKKVNRSFVLQVKKDHRSEDDVVFNFAMHQWCYLGTCVYKMGWVGLDRTLAYTRLMERKTEHLRRRARSEDGVFWNF
tara:strand:- start:156 stop:1142 length:987 start_codon:yes stop_codon:yes gene_type:complete